jgi:DNA polymerase IIIc chi subunit
MNRVVLFQVRQPSDKLARVVEACTDHFGKKERILVFAEDERGAKFVDDLLWKSSFLPHQLEAEDLISITTIKKNLNQAPIAFNLCPTPLLLEGFRIIYDFEDLTSLSKKQFSSLRFDAYKKAGYPIESR